MEEVDIRLFASAASAAGTREMKATSGTLSQILQECSIQQPKLKDILPQCSFLIDGVAHHDFEQKIHPHSQIDILPRFAGG